MGRTRTDVDRMEAISRIGYEIKMLSSTAAVLGRERKRKLSWVYHNSTVHSFLLAVRNLHEFFFANTARDGRIIAAQLVTPWTCPAPRFRDGKHWTRIDQKKHNQRRTPFIAMVSQRLHHITWSRVDESKIDWNEPAILKEFRAPIEMFASSLPSAQRSKYFNRAVAQLRKACENT